MVLGSGPLWYKDAIIYQLHVKAFQDSTGNGRGDFRGLIGKLDYIRDLGATAIWLLPFYPSPQRDDGYDIADYRGIHPSFGTMQDFKAFVKEAHRKGLRVITELVINHTSDQHSWFQAARHAPRGSAKRNWYVWSDTDTRYQGTRIIFTDTEQSNWTWDAVAGQYYWHRFFSHQPDLNFENPQVLRAVTRALRYWLDMGVDGLRLDAIPYLCEREGTNCENLPETHAVIKQLRRVVDENYSDRMLLAEANQWPDDVREYFGDGDECHMAFHFPLMPRIFMALRQEDRRPIVDILARTPEIPESCQWAIFLRNHDELTLEMVTDEERDYMYREYAKDPRMKVNVGIRRRLAPLVDNGRRRIELLTSLLLSFPGTPILYYGDEIGMGDNIYLGDRDGVRTPMQWSQDRNAGFSRADPASLYLPLIMDPVYGYEAVNVEAQERNPSSLLHFMRRMIALRRQHAAFGRGTLEFLKPRNRRVLAYIRRYQGEVILAVANLCRYAQPVELDLGGEFEGWTPLEMLGRTEFPPIGTLPYFLTLGPHSFYWFRLEPQAEPIHLVRGEGADLRNLPWLTLEEGFDLLFAPEYRFTLANDVIGPFLRRQRWFQGKSREIASLAVTDWCKLGAAYYIVLVETSYADGGKETYVLPLKAARGEGTRRLLEEASNVILARIHTAEGEGVLFDALADRPSCATLFSTMVDGRTYHTDGGAFLSGFRAEREDTISRLASRGTIVRQPSGEQSNTSVILDQAIIVKVFRRVETGTNPDLEISRYLTEATGFRALAPLAGGIEYRGAGGNATIAMAQSFVASRGDGWSYLRERLDEFLTRPGEPAPPSPDLPLVELASEDPPPAVAERAGEALAAARLLGRRTAEFHGALSSPTRDRAFQPVSMTQEYLQSLAESCTNHARDALRQLGEARPSLPAAAAEEAGEVLSIGTALLGRFELLEGIRGRPVRTRIHGDYHLGQVLRVEDDFILLDFEGEPLRSLEERREKASPLRDVAGMLRSFGYLAQSIALEPPGSPPAGRPHDDPRATTFEAWMCSSFLGAYLQTASGAPFLPDDPAELQTLLDAFILDKAFYELGYELNNRPTWVGIPLRGILSILRASPSEGGPNDQRGDSS